MCIFAPPGKDLYQLLRGAVPIWICCLTSIGISIIKISQSHDHLIFIMEISIPGMTIFVLRQGPRDHLNMEVLSHQYRHSHYKNKMAMSSLEWESPYLKRPSLCWEGGHVVMVGAFSPSGAEIKIFWESEINVLATDVMAPSIARSSAAIVLTP